MGPTWVLWDPDGPHVGLMNLAIRVAYGTFAINAWLLMHTIYISMIIYGTVSWGQILTMVTHGTLAIGDTHMTNMVNSLYEGKMTVLYWNITCVDVSSLALLMSYLIALRPSANTVRNINLFMFFSNLLWLLTISNMFADQLIESNDSKLATI